MALIFMDGFDHYTTPQLPLKWNSIGTGISIAPTGGRRGGGALVTGDSSGYQVSKALPGAFPTVIIGFAFAPMVAGSGSTTDSVILVVAGSLMLVLGSSGNISVYRSSTLLATTTTTIPVGSYAFIELKVTVHNTAGAYQLRINGADAIAYTSGVDTATDSAERASSIALQYSRFSSNAGYYDDLYVCDDTGTENNDFLGDVRIEPFFPSGAGAYQQFVPSTGTDHAALVDESTPNTTDYLTGGAAGTKETFTLDPVGTLPSSDLIVAVQVNNFVKKSDAGGAAVRNLIRSGTDEATGPTTALSTSYTYVRSIHELDPATGQPWLLGAVEVMEAGLEVVS